ncbi:MAG: type II toxin-antitoxin system HicB family antitoxin [Desulfobulbaceae bacterium]|jgi:predicted RNase H-like HicB family nuclease|nr:type II toxin-antitoxin system HicB family antitoxin [Desulfobulbaceae bacterium]
MHYPATLAPKDDGRYDVTFADLPGCVSQGENLEDALRMAEEALHLHLETMIEDGDALPAPSSIEAAKAKDEEDAAREGYKLPGNTLYQFIVADPEAAVDATVRLSISLRASVIRRIDRLAKELGLSRSGLIAVAAREYAARW